VGRLFSGDRAHVTFRQETVDALAVGEHSSFDLVILGDVMHHVPTAERRNLLRAIRRRLAQDGSLVFKDWCPSATAIHWMCAASDRYLTGDDVHFATVAESRALVADVFGPDGIRADGRVRPWSNNFVFLVRPRDTLTGGRA
jgi:2-polyprenyl-6-hydroxyphenyl methylase/3-demethylubiquinone-9 3-methyltransferase